MDKELGHPLRDGLSSQAMEPQASPPKASIPDAVSNLSWIDQYAFVGPALFEMENFPNQVNLVRHSLTQVAVIPHEVWCPINQTWVRLDGTWVSGWKGIAHFAFRPTFVNRIKIRMAARSWKRHHDRAENE